MNRSNAKKIAEYITNAQLQEMFDNAKSNIKDWTKESSVNKSMTIGTSWNIFTKNFDVNSKIHNLAKINMIWEFGNYLPKEAKLPEKPKVINKPPVHQNPIF